MRLIIITLLLSVTTISFSQTKIEKISNLLELCDFNAIGESMVDGYMKMYGSELPGNQEFEDSMKVWVAAGYEAMMDSMVLIYDTHFTEKDIDEMITFYNTRVGEKLTKLSPLLMDLGVRAGTNWGEENKAALEAKIKPIVEREKEKYSYESLYNPDEEFLKMNPYTYTIPETSTSKYESKVFSYAVNYHPGEWEIVDCKGLNPSADVCFQTPDQSAYSLIIGEEVEADLHQLKGVALSNMYHATKEVEINKVGLVEVNNMETLNMKINATVNGIDIIYDNYYVTPEWGIIQVLTFCAKGDYEKSKIKMQNINNGIELK